MAEVVPFPDRGAVVTDARGGDRALRVTRHDADGVVVLSLWRGDTCQATFRVLADDVPALLDALSGYAPAVKAVGGA